MFNVFKGVLNNTPLTDENEKKINNYIFKRYISGNIDGLMFSSYINSYDVPNSVLYEYYRCILGKRKIKYIPYVKSEKSDKIKDLEFIKNHYKCNDNIALEYLELLPQDELKKLKANYNIKD